MITPIEIERILSQCPLVYNPGQLHIDYDDEAAQMEEAFSVAGKSEYLPLLAWHGIGTRWQLLLQWLDQSHVSGDLEEVFAAFAHSLGRLTSYRALALTEEQLQAIWAADTLVPSGRLKTDAVTLDAYLQEQGVRQILEKRINRLGALRYDPSLSLHDYPEIAVSVASDYVEFPHKPIYRFEVEVPVIETVGWRMCDVNGWTGWFRHRNIWYDPNNPRTERFMLLELPFFAARCKSVRIFTSEAEIADYLRPFITQQERLHREATALAT